MYPHQQAEAVSPQANSERSRRNYRNALGVLTVSAALAASCGVSSINENESDRLPSRLVIGNTEIKYSEWGVRIITDLEAPDGSLPTTQYCRDNDLLTIQKELPPAGISPWKQIEIFETGAAVVPGYAGCDDRLLTPDDFIDQPLALR